MQQSSSSDAQNSNKWIQWLGACNSCKQLFVGFKSQTQATASAGKMLLSVQEQLLQWELGVKLE